MIQLIPIEPKDDTHGMLIVNAFNELFIEDGGLADGGNARNGNGRGCGYGWNDYDYGDPSGDGSSNISSELPEEWRVGRVATVEPKAQ